MAVAARQYWKSASVIVTLTALSAVLGVYLASIVGYARIVYAMGRDGTLPGWFAQLHPKYRVPWNAQHVVLGVTLLADALWARWLGIYLSYDWWGTAVVFFAMISNIFVNVGCTVYFFRYKRNAFHWLWHGVIPLLGVVTSALAALLLLRTRPVARGMEERAERHSVLPVRYDRLRSLHGGASPVAAERLAPWANLQRRIEPKASVSHEELRGSQSLPCRPSNCLAARVRADVPVWRTGSCPADSGRPARIRRGAKLEGEGRHEQAARKFQEAIDINPEFADAYQQLAAQRTSRRQRRRKRSKHFSQLIQLEPANKKAMLAAADAYLSLELYDDALALYSRALHLDPRSPDIYYSVGNVLVHKKQYADAISCAREGAFHRSVKSCRAEAAGIDLLRGGQRDRRLENRSRKPSTTDSRQPGIENRSGQSVVRRASRFQKRSSISGPRWRFGPTISPLIWDWRSYIGAAESRHWRSRRFPAC